MKIGIDFDGTIVDSKNKQMQLLNMICNAYEIKLDLDAFWEKKRTGLSNTKILESINVQKKDIQEISKHWINQVESQYWSKFDTIFSDSKSFLTHLKNNGHTIHLITARQNTINLEQQLKYLGLNFFLDSYHVVHHPQVDFKKSQIILDQQIELFIGDTETDYTASKLSNIIFLGVSTGIRSKEFMLDYGINTIYPNLSSLTSYIDQV